MNANNNTKIIIMYKMNNNKMEMAVNIFAILPFNSVHSMQN